MDKQIEFRNFVATPLNSPQGQQRKKISASFDDLLASYSQHTTTGIVDSTEAPYSNEIHQRTPSLHEPVLLGEISKKHPTVSELLINHEGFGDKGWKIIFSDINRDKPYNKIPTGTPIYLDPVSKELSWHTQKQTKVKKNTVALGRVDNKLPTVSHLLAAQSEFTEDKWNIIAANANKDKDFTRIPAGAEIFLNLQTKEISWHHSANHEEQPLKIARIANATEFAKEKLQAMSSTAQLQTGLRSDNLTEAVQSFMGKPYEEIDCYGLLVHGLQKMGIPYVGKDGLRNMLTQMAEKKGLPSNALHNGEGIVEVAGKRILSQTFTRVSNWTREANHIFQKMKPQLQKGQILSFSTPTRGHTGIVSQHENQWTFINSGKMDNHVAQPSSPKEVGEERLLSEIVNWFKLANRNRESLMVTLGQLEEEKIRTALQPAFNLPKRL